MIKVSFMACTLTNIFTFLMISFFGQSNGTAPGEVDLFLLPLVDFIIKTHLAIFITGFGVYIELLMTTWIAG